MKSILLIVAAIAIAIVPASAVTSKEKESIVASIHHKLRTIKTSKDSLPYLYDLYDLSDKAGTEKAAKQIYLTAKRAGDNRARLDMLRFFSKAYSKNDSALDIIAKEIATIPKSSDREATRAFNKMLRNGKIAGNYTHAEKVEKLEKLMSEERQAKNIDIYDRIVTNYIICTLLGSQSQSGLYKRYLAKLGALLDSLPEKSIVLNNVYYTNAAHMNTYSGNPGKGLEADRALLASMDKMQKEYSASGRHYRSYDTNRYASYRRMLHNSDSLSAKEVEQIYAEVLKLVANNADVAQDFNTDKRAKIYYLMATGKYSEALPLLKQRYVTEEDPYLRLYLLKLLRKAAEKTGDNETLLRASTIYASQLEDYYAQQNSEIFDELEIMSEVNELKDDNTALTVENNRIKLETGHTIIIICVASCAVLLLLIFFLFMNYTRAKGLTKSLAKTNTDLKERQHELDESRKELRESYAEASMANKVKDAYLDDMGEEIRTPMHTLRECADRIAEGGLTDEQQRATGHTLHESLEYLLLLVNDMVNVSHILNSDLQLHHHKKSVSEIIEAASLGVRDHIKPGVKFEINPTGEPDAEITTDAQRVEQVLSALLDNAAKFTTDGIIKLEYKIANGHVKFSVTDTGIGLPMDRIDHIFDRFMKGNPKSPGAGLGLYLSKTIAKILKGSLQPDLNYKNGTRMVFTVPDKGAPSLNS